MEHFGACVATVIIISFSALCTMAHLFKNSPKMDQVFFKSMDCRHSLKASTKVCFLICNEFHMFILFWPEKVHFEVKFLLFLTFTLIIFLVQTLQCAETIILDLFYPWKDEKTNLKSRILNQNCRNFNLKNVYYSCYKSLASKNYFLAGMFAFLSNAMIWFCDLRVQ